jgi:hypothetical protein
MDSLSDLFGKLSTNAETPHQTVLRLIEMQKEKESVSDIWKDSPYKDLVKLQSNNVGELGEILIDTFCKASGIPSNCNGKITKQIGGGKGDGTILDCFIEIKTAHQGCTSKTFQHELGEVPWKGSDYMIFLDIAPSCLYLTIFKNFEESVYKSEDKLVCFPTKTITWRKRTGAFKLDTSVKINEQSILDGIAIKIDPTTTSEFIGNFIRHSLKTPV